MVILIFLLGLFLRIHNLEQLAGFDFDQEVAAFWIRDFVVNHKLSLIGQEISVGGVYIAPFFYYLLTPFYLLTKLYPLGGNIFVTFVAIVTMIMIYRFTKQVFNHKSAVIATFLYAIHPGIINFDRTVAPSNLIILLSVSTASILVKLHKNWFDFLLLGIIFGLTFSVHPTAVALIPITILYFLVKKEKVGRKNILLMVFPATILFSPLVFFDLRHHGLMIHNIFTALFSGQGLALANFISSIFERTQLLLVYWAGMLISNDNLIFKLPLFALAIWIFFKSSGIILKLWVLVSLVVLVVYPRHVPEYYFLLLTPIVLIYTVGYLTKSRIGQGLLTVIIIISVAVSILQFRSPDNKLGLYYKNEAVKYIISQSKGLPFTVYYSNKPGQNFGFNYLFWWHQAKIADKMPKKFLIVVPVSERIYHPSRDFGRIKVFPLPEESKTPE